MKISFLASHGGTSARAVIEGIRSGRLKADIGILITNNRDSDIFHWCLDNDVEVRHISAKSHRGEGNADEAIATVLGNAGTDLVVCSGYMKKIGPRTLEAFEGRILNIHPSLLPRYGGKGMYGDHVHHSVLASGEKETGATVHYVTEGYDEGPAIRQVKVPVLPGDTLESLRDRVRACEPELYLQALEVVLDREQEREGK